MNTEKLIITTVEPDSIAFELDIEPGDILISINEKSVADVLDYRFLISDEHLDIIIMKPSREEWLLEVEKEEYEDLGISFNSGLMDDARSCKNKCIFCFIDQLPKGLRPSLYFKDDDSRLSFLTGNYITLTNMKDSDIDRIISYRLSPINISVHTADPKLRCFMLNNKRAGEVLGYLNRFKTAGILMNLQIVLCRDVNDGENLKKTIAGLAFLMPQAQSLSVVPVGLSKYREENKLYPLEAFDKTSAEETLAIIGKYQKRFLKEHGSRFVYAADEFYLMADKALPAVDEYEGFPQLENGVGMTALFKDEFYTKLAGIKTKAISRTVSVATGSAAYALMLELTGSLMEKLPELKVQVFEIHNDFFGGAITVSGLLTGCDIINQLRNQFIGDLLLLPQSCLRSGEDVLLDDITVSDIALALGAPVLACPCGGAEFIDSIIGS